MSDVRPRGEYDWLFDPDATRAPSSINPKAPPLPTAPPLPGGPDDLPPPNLPAPKRPVKRGASGGGRRGPANRWRRWASIGIVTLPVLWLIYLAVVPVLAWSTVSTLQTWPDGNRPAEQPGTTYLIVGSDSRKGLTEEEQKELTTGKDDGGAGRTDTIMLLHTGAGKPTLVSIPRDSVVTIPGYSRTKINAAYAFGGPELLVQTMEENTGVRVDRYVEVGFGGVVSLVDAVGGVQICPKDDAKDKLAGLDIKKGCQEVDGKTALAYSRTRHAYVTGDIQRVQNQREVIAGLGGKLRSPATVIDPIRYFRVVTGGAASVSVDNTAEIPDMARFAIALSTAMGSGGRNCNVPIADLAVNWDATRAPAFFEHLRTDTTDDLDDLCTKDGLLPEG